MIAEEISIALICTAMGLATAIPFNFMLASLTTRIRNFQDALGAGLMRVLDFLKTRTLSEADLAMQLARLQLGTVRIRRADRRAGPIRNRPSSTSRRWSTWCS